ncbi:MAG: glutathione peroxidase [Bacteroidales bacterium]|nr:glutathione peroxidase [Bacteroidales bacterium]
MSTSFYDLTATSLSGKPISMEQYRGKVVMVVNTASKCGFTPQLEGLEALYEKYSEKGLVILGFPCNQFANQEPGSEESIAQGCVLNYGVTFQMFSKIDVNGNDAHPVYQWLKSQPKGRGTMGNAIKWNFTKFLLDREGNVVGRYGSIITPEKLEQEVLKLL